MKNKIKIVSLMLALSSLVFSAEPSKYNSELMVTGDGIRERVDYTLYSREYNDERDGEYWIHSKYTAHEGDNDARHAVYAEKGSEVHNIGSIKSYSEQLDTNTGGLLIMGIDNPLKRADNLIALRGIEGNLTNKPVYTTFKNDGLVEMGGMFHNILAINIAGIIPTSVHFADYEKNTINAKYAIVENNGTITNKNDSVKYTKGLDVGVLNGFIEKQEKNAIFIENGSVKNTGLIEYNRDEKFELINGIAVDLLQIGLEYNRDTSGINSKDSTIENSGEIFVGGDIVTKGEYSGIGVSALGADLRGNHKKYGIKSNGGTVINTGTIEVERDFKKALDDNNNILDLYLIYHNVLKLGLLSFSNLKEASIGAHIENEGIMYNNGGTISVGVNESKKFNTQLREGMGVAVSGNKGSTIYFNTDTKNGEAIWNEKDEKGNDIKDEEGNLIPIKSTINLEGKNVYATYLTNNSNAVFNGLTEINYVMPGGLDEEDKKNYLENRNKDIFYADETSHIYINGTVKAYGNINLNDRIVFADDKGSKVPIKNENNETIGYEISGGQVASTGKIGLNGNLKVDTTNFVGMSGKDIEKYFGHKYVEADGGITGNGNLVSSSYLFDIKADKTNNSISLTDVNRKNFNTIVENKELGKILEDSYEGVSGEKLDFYKYISLGDSYESFSERLNEITGIDNITTLEAQVVDITKDLNRQYKGFIKNNKEEGVVFSYLNSKSEIGEQGKYSGFERESNGFMSGYNKYVLDNLRVGAGLSYMKSSIDYTDESSNKIETWNARAYSDYKIKDINLLSDISLGYNQSENKRFVGGNLHDGDVNIYTLGINNSLYKNYNITDRFSINPSINLDFTYYYQDDYKENDGKFSVNADKTDGYYGTLGTTVDLKYDIFASGNSKVSLVGGIEYSYDILSSTEDIKLENITGKFSEEKRELDKDSLVYKVGVEYNYNNDYSVGLEYSKEIINDVDNEKIGLNFVYKF